MTAPKPKLRWFQFSLRTLLVFVTLCAIPCSWLAVKMQQAKRQRAATDAIEKLGGSVGYDFEFDAKGNFINNAQPPGPVWLRTLLGNDLFSSVKTVDFIGTPVTDIGLEHLKGLSQLQQLYLGGTQVTSAGLEHLKGLSHLKTLSLDGTQVTDIGLEHLKGLRQLETLYLDCTPVTDVGLEHLKGLNQLQVLDLRETKVTNAGVKKLQQALPDCQIFH